MAHKAKDGEHAQHTDATVKLMNETLVKDSLKAIVVVKCGRFAR
jgi:hypothetical protein